MYPLASPGADPSAPRTAALDILRAGLATLVCAGHLRAFLFVDHPQVEAPGLLVDLFYVVTGLGHESVILFFVLSGWFVGGTAWRAAAAGRFRLSAYAIARLTRLWVVLVPGLVLTGLLDGIGIALTDGQGYDGSRWAQLHSGPGPGPADLGAPTLIGNLFFLQTLLVPVFGSNGPLWSLANEFWYYAFFVLLVPWIAPMEPGRGRTLRAAGIVGALAVAWCFPPQFLLGFAYWMLGCLAAIARRAWTGGDGAWALAAVVTTFVATLGYARIDAGPVSDAALALAGAALMFVLCAAEARPGVVRQVVESAVGRFGVWASEHSYTLYVLHFPVFAFASFAGSDGARAQPGPLPLLLYALALTLAVVLARIPWWFSERHTTALRRRVQQGWEARTTARPPRPAPDDARP